MNSYRQSDFIGIVFVLALIKSLVIQLLLPRFQHHCPRCQLSNVKVGIRKWLVYKHETHARANAPRFIFASIANAQVCTCVATLLPVQYLNTPRGACAQGWPQPAVGRWLSACLINDPSETCPATLELMYLPQSTWTKLCSERKWCQQPLAFTHKKIKIYCHHRRD